MGILAVDASLQTRNVSQTSTLLRKQSRDRDAILDLLRNEFYRSATLVRDYLLEQDDAVAAKQKTELEQLRTDGEAALKRYADTAPANEREAVRSLRQLSDSYWTALSPALDWNPVARREGGHALLHNSIVPGRNQVVQFAKQVSALDERVLDAAEEDIQRIQAGFQRRVIAISGLALLLGLILAIVVTLHTRRLGAEAATRYDEALAAREDLRRLSERLVTVQEEERRNLSRELHDDLGQVMSAMIMELGKLDAGPSDTPARRDALASLRHLAEENVAKVRDMALLLRPAMLDELGLIPALRWQAREVARRTGLRVKFVSDDLSDDLPESHRTCVFRVVQEALNNCVKHSRATDVRVVLHRDATGLSVSVQDDGAGFDASHSKGLGLLGMTERVTGLGGRFHIDSKPGQGTVLSAWFPLDPDCCKVLEAVF